MLKKNKSRIIISSIIILLPMIFGLIMWDKLPDTMTPTGEQMEMLMGSAERFSLFSVCQPLL